MAEWLEPRDLLDVAGVEEELNHVEDEQGLHPVVGETFPRFGKRDVTETTRVSDETAVLRIVHRGRVLPRLPFGKRCDDRGWVTRMSETNRREPRQLRKVRE